MKPRRCSQKLDKTGSVLIGKLSMVELAGGGGYRTAAASLFGPGLNPWDRILLGRRIVQRLGKRGSRRAGALRARLGDLRVHHYSLGLLRRHRAAPDLWTGQPAWRHGAVMDNGQDRPDVPQRGRLRAGAAGHRRLGFERSRLGGKKFLLHASICAEAQRSEGRLRAIRSRPGRNPARPALQAAMQVIRDDRRTNDGSRVCPTLPYGTLADVIIGAEEASIFETLITAAK